MTNSRGFGGVVVGRTPTSETPASKTTTTTSSLNSNPNANSPLTSSLRASFELMKEGDDSIPSPLSEATPDSVDILLDRINSHMIEGKILSDADLRISIDVYRSQALKFAQESQNKKPRARAGTRATLKQVLDLDLDFDAASEPEPEPEQ